MSKTRNLKVAYLLMAFLGLQGIHQFYLGNWKRGLSILLLCHAPVFWFAYLEQQSQATGEPIALVPSIIIFFALIAGLILFLQDGFTLHKQYQRRFPITT
jgi:TM2 domain-containing membrane protein YozV